MAKEQDKKMPPPSKTENSTSNSNEGFASKMTQKLLDALGKKLPDAWRNSPGQEEEKPSDNSWFPWGGSDKPGGVV